MVTLLNHENVDINIRGNNLILNMNKPSLNYFFHTGKLRFTGKVIFFFPIRMFDPTFE